MINKLKNVLFVVCIVMVFTAQSNRPQDEKQRASAAPGRAPQQAVARKSPQVQVQAARPQPQAARPQAARPQPQAARPQVARPQPQAARRQGARPGEQRPSYQPRVAPRVYATPVFAPVVNNRLFNRQHHKHWQPLYNFYGNEYHFYPYVNIAATVELSSDCVAVGFDGLTYYYDRGTFYQQDQQGQYVAVAPPIGIMVSVLPPHARQIDINGQIYFRYKGICYIQTPQGFQVVEQMGSSLEAS